MSTAVNAAPRQDEQGEPAGGATSSVSLFDMMPSPSPEKEPGSPVDECAALVACLEGSGHAFPAEREPKPRRGHALRAPCLGS